MSMQQKTIDPYLNTNACVDHILIDSQVLNLINNNSFIKIMYDKISNLLKITFSFKITKEKLI